MNIQTKNKKETFKILLITVISVFLIAIIVKAATTIGTNIVTGGALSVGGNATTSGNLIIGSSSWAAPTSTLTVVGTVYINNKATSSDALWLGTGGTANNINLTGGDLYVQNDAEIDGALYVTGNAVISGTASTTSAIFSGNATTTGNMVMGHNNANATTTLTFGSYNSGAADGVCLKFWQSGSAVYCVAGAGGITCSATSCE